MKKTPSALKWLAEKRARVAGDLVHMEGLLAEVQAHVAKLSGELNSLDATIAIYDSAIQAHLIAPIHAWQDRYGRRGAFKDALLKVLRERAPDALSTQTLALEMIAQFGLQFSLVSTRQAWQKKSLLSELGRLVKAGLVERMHDPDKNELGYWRWRQDEPPTLAQLRAAAEAVTAGESS
jgi:hypothetical protein